MGCGKPLTLVWSWVLILILFWGEQVIGGEIGKKNLLTYLPHSCYQFIVLPLSSQYGYQYQISVFFLISLQRMLFLFLTTCECKEGSSSVSETWPCRSWAVRAGPLWQLEASSAWLRHRLLCKELIDVPPNVNATAREKLFSILSS